ncbi:transcriptional regulator domain-containing protein [Sphingopyxis sp. KK2]|uniref:transcriptional regulator domain-containing protein n=1 Tax=Sphingopyxis sp. KK2 TaxID=1855727 RepID=UPI00097E5797|nr:DUF2285 domain-containing protein [Sphingopyxis sp. KK2]
MERTIHLDAPPVVPDWHSAANYAALLDCDRRSFAWEWLRRSAAYRSAFVNRGVEPSQFGLVAFVDPVLAASEAKPIWSPLTDPYVLDSRIAGFRPPPGDQFDIRTLAPFVSVEIADEAVEHWLLTNGKWSIRIDLHDGTLLGGPLLLDHRLQGLSSIEPKLAALKRLVALTRNGDIPVGLAPREVRAARWILELRTGDALAVGASQQDMARTFFGNSVTPNRWRLDSSSYRLRVQRLVKAARRHLGAPLAGPWFN